MPAQKTGPDSLGVYYTDSTQYNYRTVEAGSLGGYSSLNQISLIPAIITKGNDPSPLGDILVEFISGGDTHVRNTVGKIFCVGDNTFAYQAPGESGYGTSYAVEPEAYGYLQALTDTDSFVRIKNEADTGGIIQTYGTPLELQFFTEYNNILGQVDPSNAERVTGKSSYRAVMFKNHGSTEITNLKVWQSATNYSGTRIAKEAPVSSQIQVIANETTAPAGVSWNTGTASGTGLDIGTLAAAAEYGVWVNRVIAASATAGAKFSITLNFSFTVDGSNYTQSWTGHFRIPDTGLPLYLLYTGVDTDPSFAAAVASSATLPFTYALAPPGAGTRSYNYVVRYVDEYFLYSQNTYYRTVKINSAGVDVSDTIALSTPYNVTVSNTQSGKLLVQARYGHNSDETPGDYFDIYEVANESTLTVPSNSQLLHSVSTVLTVDPHSPGAFRLLRKEIGPYPKNAVVQIGIKVRESISGNESALSTVVSATVDTLPPSRIRDRVPFLSFAHTHPVALFTQDFETDTDISVPNSIKWVQGPGYTKLVEGANIIFKFIYNARNPEWNGLWTRLGYEQASITGTASDSPVEVESWGGSKILNFVMNSTARRLKIDYTNLFFSCAAIESSLDLTSIKHYINDDPLTEFDWFNTVQVWDVEKQEYTTVASLQDNGVLLLRGGLNVVLSDSDIP